MKHSYIGSIGVFLMAAGLAVSAWAQTSTSPIIAGVYTCVDAKGRKLTSDRPIYECADRTQQEMTTTGTVKRVIGPTLTAR